MSATGKDGKEPSDSKDLVFLQLQNIDGCDLNCNEGLVRPCIFTKSAFESWKRRVDYTIEVVPGGVPLYWDFTNGGHGCGVHATLIQLRDEWKAIPTDPSEVAILKKFMKLDTPDTSDFVAYMEEELEPLWACEQNEKEKEEKKKRREKRASGSSESAKRDMDSAVPRKRKRT